MRCVSVCVLAAAAAMLWAGTARAEREAGITGEGSGFTPWPAPPRPAAAQPRPVTFAPASAANARKMTAEQREERRFLKEAAAASRFESEASRMALAKSHNAGVRSFAATLINHHALASITLQHMLHGRGMAPPMLANDQRKTLNRLAKLGGAKFDREYMEEVGLKYQQEDLQAFEKAALTARDPALRGWIARTLPTLRYHLATAERIGAPDVKPAKPIGPRASIAVPGSARPAAVRPKARAAPKAVSQPQIATQFMGAGPMQLGVTQPVAAWPGEDNR